MRHPMIAALAGALALAAAAAGAALAAPAPAQRIVSLSPTATETLYAIGAGKQVVAVDEDSDYPRAAPRTKLSGVTPNVEAIARYRPDLVVVSNDLGKVVEGLRKLRIPVLLQPAAPDLPHAYAEMDELGRVTGHERSAQALVRRLRARVRALVASVPRGRTLTVYHELDPTLYSATSHTFIGRIYALFGLRNIADAADKTGSGYPQLSSEYVVAANPDLIVLADTRCCGESVRTLAARPGWSQIAAVRDRLVVRLDDDIASRWGPRVVDFVRAVASAVTAARR